MRKLLEQCPNCGGELEITEVRCTQCDTTIRAHYAPCPFCRLDEDTLAFIEDFMRSRGNLREMARESGESYWTLRARLNDVVRTMGLEAEEAVEEDALAERRREVLLQVQQGKLAAAEAATVLAALSADNE
ncbi:MAG: DUF2089 domain-containing protein [Anaerolineae bacterium]|jgi:hypothetical protein